MKSIVNKRLVNFKLIKSYQNEKKISDGQILDTYRQWQIKISTFSFKHLLLWLGENKLAIG